MSAPPLRPDWALIDPKCRNCGRDVRDRKAHWHDLCYPWLARAVVGAFALFECYLLARLVMAVLT